MDPQTRSHFLELHDRSNAHKGYQCLQLLPFQDSFH